MEQLQGGGAAPTFQPLNKVTCVSFSNSKERKRNMRWAMHKDRGYHRVTELIIPHNEQDIAIVAGGPSLNETYPQINNFKYIMTCGSAHDHAVKLGIKATYHVECDPDIHQIGMYREKSQANYLISSRCHRSMFRRLEKEKLYLWHMLESDLGKPIYNGEPAFVCGATVTLSAIPIALALQFKHLHFFGFDCSFPDKEHHHAYPQPENCMMIQVKVGDPTEGREFQTTATWAGQVQQFEDMQNHWPFASTIYGDSLMREVQIKRANALAKQQGVAA